MSEIEPTFLSQVDMLEAVLCAAAGGICYDCVKHGGDGKRITASISLENG